MSNLSKLIIAIPVLAALGLIIPISVPAVILILIINIIGE